MQTTCECRMGSGRVHVAKVPIDVMSVSELLDVYAEYVRCDHAHVTHHLAAHPIVVAEDDPGFRRVLLDADLNLPDGMGVVWATRSRGAGRLYGPTVMIDVLRWGIERGLRHTFVGGSTATLNILRDNLLQRLPELRISGTYAPPFRDVTPAGVKEDLQELGTDADFLWVGLGTPKQQLWAEIARAHRPARVISTVGAAFDFHAGVKRQAPEWMQRAGLEWAFRLATEPRRLWRRYLVGNVRFVTAVAASRFVTGGRDA